MSVLKRLEVFAKLLLAWVAGALLHRPGRRKRSEAQLRRPRRILLVRIDNRVGEALLTTPLLSALTAKFGREAVEVLVHGNVARVLAGHPDVSRVLAFDRRRLWMGPFAPGIRALRREGFDVVVNCANWEVPSVTSALVSRWVGSRATVVGPAIWPIAALMDVPVIARTDTVQELAQRFALLAPLGISGTAPRLSFRVPRSRPALAEFLGELRSAPHAVVNPGGRLDWRRIPPEAFAAAARALSRAGRRAVITWGPGEEALAAEVLALVPKAVLAPPTTLDDLAAVMEAAGCTVCNNTGPMHLSVALGVPTLGLFLKMQIERWGHPQAPHRMTDLTAENGLEALCARVEAEVTDFVSRLGRAPTVRRASGLPPPT